MENGLLFQAFEWYLSDDGNYYKDMLLKLDELKEMGVTAIWLPPVYKGTGRNDTGYGPYDIFDLGEFDQKGSIRTKYGTKEELKELISEIHKREMAVYADVVLNHKAGADRAEKFMAVMVDEQDRTKAVNEPKEIEAWTGFDFPGRDDKYSDFKWNYNHFKGEDFYVLGEYWVVDADANNSFLDRINYQADLFDVGLHFNLYQAAKDGSEYDLRKIFDNAIAKTHPLLSVTFVDNHDSQPGES